MGIAVVLLLGILATLVIAPLAGPLRFGPVRIGSSITMLPSSSLAAGHLARPHRRSPEIPP
jgi:hypothetical protein